jgi:hypothetical protein
MAWKPGRWAPLVIILCLCISQHAHTQPSETLEAGIDQGQVISENKEGDDDKWESKVSELLERNNPVADQEAAFVDWDSAVCSAEDAPQPVRTKLGGDTAIVHYKPSAPAVIGSIAVMTGLKIKRTVFGVIHLGRSALVWIKGALQRRKNRSTNSKSEVYVWPQPACLPCVIHPDDSSYNREHTPLVSSRSCLRC